MKLLGALGILFALVLSSGARSLAQSPGQAAAPSSVTLLISLDRKAYPKGIPALLNHSYVGYPGKLESTFRQAFADSPYRIQVIQDATAYDLYQALHDGTNAGVFWVSHTSPETFRSTSVARVLPPVYDYRRADVRDVFKNPDPAIRWISIVGCDSNLAIDWLKGQQYFRASSWNGFDTEIDAIVGLKQSIARAKARFAMDETPVRAENPSPDSQASVTIHRELRADPAKETFFPSVWVLVGPKQVPVAAFREVYLKSAETLVQDEVALIPSGSTDHGHWDLLFKSGFSAASLPQAFQLGNFTATDSANHAHWNAFASRGLPLGVTSVLLEFDEKDSL